MRLMKILTLTATLGILGYLSFNITYDKVSAIVLREAEENKKNEIVIRPIDVDEENEDNTYITEEIEEEIEEEIKKLNIKTNDYIFIGDSRLNALKDISNNIGFNSVNFITSESADCNWINSFALNELDYILNSTNGYFNIIFSPGINDLNNVNKYINLFNNLANKYSNHNVFVLGVGPLDEIKYIKNNVGIVNSSDMDFIKNNIVNNESPSDNIEVDENNENNIDNDSIYNNIDFIKNNIDIVNNDDIYNFNIDIMKNVNDNVNVIHVFQELMLNGYKTIDGYHLEKDTSISLLKFIKNHIESLQP